MNSIIVRLKEDIANREKGFDTISNVEIQNISATHKQNVKEINEVIARLRKNTIILSCDVNKKLR